MNGHPRRKRKSHFRLWQLIIFCPVNGKWITVCLFAQAQVHPGQFTVREILSPSPSLSHQSVKLIQTCVRILIGQNAVNLCYETVAVTVPRITQATSICIFLSFPIFSLSFSHTFTLTGKDASVFTYFCLCVMI